MALDKLQDYSMSVSDFGKAVNQHLVMWAETQPTDLLRNKSKWFLILQGITFGFGPLGVALLSILI